MNDNTLPLDRRLEEHRLDYMLEMRRMQEAFERERIRYAHEDFERYPDTWELVKEWEAQEVGNVNALTGQGGNYLLTLWTYNAESKALLFRQYRKAAQS